MRDEENILSMEETSNYCYIGMWFGCHLKTTHE